MKLCSIVSGSSGNCVYVGSGQTNLLVDAGVSAKRIEHGLSGIDVHPDTLQGILVTHEHTDHISGIGVMARKYNVPIYGTSETLHSIQQIKSMGKIPMELFRPIQADETFYINDIAVEPFATSHDAVNPVCYTLQAEGHKVGVATDLGMYDDYIVGKLQDSDVLMIEANHDVNMLMVGHYPYYLKQRILGSRGHLSNETSAGLISKLLSSKLRHVFLAHLSKENNYEELAFETVCCELTHQGCDFSSLNLKVARRDGPSSLISL